MTFAEEATAVVVGCRPCGVCLPGHHAIWRSLRDARSDPAPVPATRRAAHTTAWRLQDRCGPLSRLGFLVFGHSRDRTARDAAQLMGDVLDGCGVDVRDVVVWPDSSAPTGTRTAPLVTTTRP